MFSLVKRNLQLYFYNISNVVLSLLGALISFILYLVFLQKNFIDQIDISKGMLDYWLIGGTLTITAITTTLSSLSRMVEDRDKGILIDFFITPLSYINIQTAYLLSSAIIGTVMQIVMYFIMQIYFGITDGLTLNWDISGKLLLVAILSSILWTIINLLILSFVTELKSLSVIQSIIGTAAGFFAGVYMPIGSLPNFAQNIMKLTPCPYNAAIYRNILMNYQGNSIFSIKMGLRFSINGIVVNIFLVIFGFIIIGSIIDLLLLRSSSRKAVSRH